MRWPDERYVRVYTRDTADWLALSFEAQGLFMMLLRKVDRAGILPLGRHGKRAVALAIQHINRWEEVIAPALDELLADGCVVIDGKQLHVPNFTEAQEASSSDKERQRKSREAARFKPDVTKRDEPSQNVTESHEMSQPVTSGHTASQAVTPSRAVPCLPSRAEPAVLVKEETAKAAPPPDPVSAMGGMQVPPAAVAQLADRRAPQSPLRALPLATTPPDTPPEEWLADDFWRWTQGRRKASGLPPEMPPDPRKINPWWSAARMTVSASVLQEAYYRFGDDTKYWLKAKPPFPFNGFMSQWTDYLPAEADDEGAAYGHGA